MSMLILSYTIKVVLVTFVPNFEIIGAVVPEKIFDTSFPMHYTGVRDGKKVKGKKRS